MPGGGSRIGARAQRALGRDPDQPVGHLADALLEPGLLGLPRAAAQLVEQPFLVAVAATAARYSRPAGRALTPSAYSSSRHSCAAPAAVTTSSPRIAARRRDPHAPPDRRARATAPRSGNSRPGGACAVARISRSPSTSCSDDAPSVSGASNPCSSAQTARCSPRLPMRVPSVIGIASPSPSSSIRPRQALARAFGIGGDHHRPVGPSLPSTCSAKAPKRLMLSCCRSGAKFAPDPPARIHDARARGLRQRRELQHAACQRSPPPRPHRRDTAPSGGAGL